MVSLSKFFSSQYFLAVSHTMDTTHRSRRLRQADRSGLGRRSAAETPPTVLSEFSCHKQIASSTRMTIGLALACFLVVPAYSSVTILEEQYHCSGETEWGSPETGYSHTDSSPVSGSRIDDWGGASSSAWKFGARAQTGASREWASAHSTFVFTVDQPILIIEIFGDLYSTAFPDTEGGISYSLTDILTNEIIGSQRWSLSSADKRLYKDGGYDWARTIDESVTYNLVTGNQYKFFLSANVGNADGTYSYLEAVLVPEPSSLLLLSFGGLCVLLHRRRV
jgi:hypothetical protein